MRRAEEDAKTIVEKARRELRAGRTYMRCGGAHNYRVGDYMSTDKVGGRLLVVVDVVFDNDDANRTGTVYMRTATLWELAQERVYHARLAIKWQWRYAKHDLKKWWERRSEQ